MAMLLMQSNCPERYTAPLGSRHLKRCRLDCELVPNRLGSIS